MKIAVLGTGMVGETIATKLVELGHQVTMGSRSADNENAVRWRESAGPGAFAGTFHDAAGFGEVVFNCTNGTNSLQALRLAGADTLRDKLLLDVANPLDFSGGGPPSLTVCNTDSLGEQIQREFPDARVVKTLNTINCEVMINPALVPGDHVVFVCGNDAAAKQAASEYLTEWFGWKPGNIIDLGDITAARGAEMMLPIWVRLWNTFGHARFNFQIVKANNAT
jgi:predicted dinucleotide-binding enzyme